MSHSRRMDLETRELMITEEMRKLLTVCGPDHAPVDVGGRKLISFFPERADLRCRWIAEQFVDARMRGVDVSEVHTVTECPGCKERILDMTGPICTKCQLPAVDPEEQAAILAVAARAWAPDRASIGYSNLFREVVLRRHARDGSGWHEYGGKTLLEAALRASLDLPTIERGVAA